MAEPQGNGDPICEDDDMFDSIVMAEERCQEEGFQEGFKQGQIVGKAQGFEMGREKGEQVGEEMGFYLGFAVAWQAFLMNQSESDKSNKRALKAVDSLISALTALPQEEPNSVKYWDTVHKTRARFKQVSSLLNISVSYKKPTDQKGFTF